MINRKTKWLTLALAGILLAGCGKKNKETDLNASAEPDKVLYDRAMKDLADGKHIIARLTLQTLINTYPDSEYLAKAKLAVADSFFKEGGSAGLTQAVAEYKDYKVFFPQTEEAAYAQMQVGISHYRRMEKPDRDRTYARYAEDELQRFIAEYPDHPLTPQAEQRLREVQEVLAEGDYRIARYYFIKGSIRAAGGRLLELVDRYPLYSNADRALMMLGQAFEKSEKGDIAGRYYARIVKDYPLSPLVPDAKSRLETLGIPVPQPDPAALERQQKQLENPNGKQKTGIMGNTVGRALGMVSSKPDVSRAATAGKPQMSPPAEPGGETLTPGGLTVTGSTAAGSGATATSAEGTPSGGATSNASAPAATGGSANAAQLAKIDPAKAEKARKKEEEEKKRREKLEESSSKKKKKN